jgi:hypothetical protein
LTGNQLKLILTIQEHIGHLGGSQYKGQGGDHQEVVIIFFVMFYIILA